MGINGGLLTTTAGKKVKQMYFLQSGKLRGNMLPPSSTDVRKANMKDE